jgi:hypothetical protein
VPAYLPSPSTIHTIHTSHSPSVRFPSRQQQLHHSAKISSPYGLYRSFSPIPQSHLQTPKLNLQIFRAPQKPAPANLRCDWSSGMAQSYVCMCPGRTAALSLVSRLSSVWLENFPTKWNGTALVDFVMYCMYPLRNRISCNLLHWHIHHSV